MYLRYCFAAIISGILWSSLPAAIQVENIQDGETIGYQLLLLKGTVPGNINSVTLHNNTNNTESPDWPAEDGEFKAVILLRTGTNRISIETEDETHEMTVHWRLMKSEEVRRYFQMTYVIPSDHETLDYGKFQAPEWEDNSIESARKRLALAGLMMQTATAEMMYDQGRDRKTFRLAREAGGNVDVLVHTSVKTFSQLQDYQPQPALPTYLQNNELSKLPDAGNAHTVLTSSVTRFLGGSIRGCYNDCPHIILAGEMWGGGSYAWFHSANLFTWPDHVNDIVTRIADTRLTTDYDMYPSRHSHGENTMWAAYSTTAGSMLHEAGHGYGLGHTNSSCGIMGFGFHNWVRMFSMTQGGEAYNNACIEWDDNNELDSDLDNSEYFEVPDPWDPSGIFYGVLEPQGQQVHSLLNRGAWNLRGQRVPSNTNNLLIRTQDGKVLRVR